MLTGPGFDYCCLTIPLEPSVDVGIGGPVKWSDCHLCLFCENPIYTIVERVEFEWEIS